MKGREGRGGEGRGGEGDERCVLYETHENGGEWRGVDESEGEGRRGVCCMRHVRVEGSGGEERGR